MRRDDYRATLIVMFGLAAASLTGFLRQAALAHQLGAGRVADVYLVAFAVPEFVFVALPIVLSPAFIPLFATCRQRAGEAAAWRFGLRTAGALLVILLALTAAAGLMAPRYLAWLSPGFDPQEHVRAVQVGRLMLPGICLMGIATLAGAALQVLGRFARPALATAVYNLAFVGVLLIAPLARPLDRAAWGVVAGAAAALALQLPLLWRHRPRDPGSDPVHPSDIGSVGQLARLAGPLALGYGVHHVILFVDRAMATAAGEGAAAALNYAYHLALAIGQLSGLAVSTALFPRLADQVAAGDADGARASLAAALRLVWAVGLPATCGLILLREPVIRLLFERGAFDRAGTAAVGGPLAWYALAVMGDALCQPLWRVIYAGRRAWTVLAVNGLQTGVRWAANLALMGAFCYNGLALSAVLGLWVQLIVLGWLVRRRLGSCLTPAWWLDAGRVILAAASIVLVVGLLLPRLSSWPPATALLAAGASGGAVYLLILWLSRFGRRSHLETERGRFSADR